MSGIYCIKVDNAIVYIGESKDIGRRIRQHWHAILLPEEENKYQLLHSAIRQRHRISFWLLEQVEDQTQLKIIEKKWIAALRPVLNTQHADGMGHHLTANEFYDVVFNETHCVTGASEWLYRKQNKSAAVCRSLRKNRKVSRRK